jgi:PAS domain S-box-containing protein
MSIKKDWGRMMVMFSQAYQQANFLGMDFFEVANLLNEGVLGIDADGWINIFNPAAELTTGLKAAGVLGKQFTEVFSSTDLSEALKRKEKKNSLEIVINGIKVSGKVEPLIKDGEFKGLLFLFAQCSAFVRELEKIKKISKELNAVIDSSFDGIFITSPDGMTERVNAAYERILGLSRQELEGKNVKALVREGVINVCITPLVVKRKKPVTTLQKLHNGKTVMITGNPIFGDDGEVIKVVTNVRDVTELYQLKEELEASKKLTKRYKTKLENFRERVFKSQEVIGNSTAMRKILELSFALAQVNSTVLIQGKSGVGKEVIARLIHNASPRREYPFVKINCGGIPENLLESELFGYVPGAFTGANREGKKGLFEAGDKGTVFLDEISELPMMLQVKLLQVLQDYQIVKVGGTEPIHIDIRIIAATNKNLEEQVEKGEFREDLFYRLNVVPLLIPELKERREDIPELLYYYLDKYNSKYGMDKKLSPEALQLLVEYSWPGNVRQLKNIVERFIVSSTSNIIDVDDLPLKFKQERTDEESAVEVRKITPLRQAVEQVEKELIREALNCSGSTYEAAKLLQVSQPTVFRKAKKYFGYVDK